MHEQPRFHDCLVTGPKLFSSTRARFWFGADLEVSFTYVCLVVLEFSFLSLCSSFLRVLGRLRNNYSGSDESSFNTHSSKLFSHNLQEIYTTVDTCTLYLVLKQGFK